MIVQRAQIEPGQRSGIHGHPGNQVYIHIKGDSWAQRHGDVQSAPANIEAGAAGWLDAVDISEGQDVGNTGDTNLEYVLVTIK